MKILHLLYESKGDYFGIGGVVTRAYSIYSYLRDRHDITLLCKKYPGANDGKIEGLKHIFVGTESKSLTKTLLSYAYNAAFFVKRYGKDFDVIIEEFSPAIPTFLNLYKKRPVVLQIQGYTGKKYFEKYNILYSTTLYILERLRPKYYKDIIVVSDITKRKFNFQKKGNIQVISNGVPEELLNIETGESDYILYLGRIDIHNKGLDILLDACSSFCRLIPEVKFVIAGDGRDREIFRGLVHKLPEEARKNIEMTGWVDGERKRSLLRDAIMVVIPSRYETQGIVALEAMAYGKPIVASDIPELSYIVNWGAGKAFNTGNAISLAQAMKKLIMSNRREEMGEKGRERVKDYTWDRIASKYERFLEGIFDENSPTHL
ncbi:MAG: glycosyltransferase family 4 protein [Candidatus Mariimomonas ferrooxydans]